MSWYLAVLKKYAVFSGRARRNEYWMLVLFNCIIGFVLVFIESIVGSPAIIADIYSLAVFIPGIAVGVRRMHDTDHSGWWLLFPLVNLVFVCIEGTRGNNRFGPDPKAGEESSLSASKISPHGSRSTMSQSTERDPDAVKAKENRPTHADMRIECGDVEFPSNLRGKVRMGIITYEGERDAALQLAVIRRLMPLTKSGCAFRTACNATIPELQPDEPACAMIRCEGGLPKAGVSLDTVMTYVALKDSLPPGVSESDMMAYWIGTENGKKVHAILLL